LGHRRRAYAGAGYSDIQRFRELRAKSLPSVALDGDLVYEAIIPGQEEISAEIRRRHLEKNAV